MIKLETERLTIRQVDAADIPAIVSYLERNREHLRPFEPMWPADYCAEDYWLKRIESIEPDYREGRRLELYLFRVEDDSRVMGKVAFSDMV